MNLLRQPLFTHKTFRNYGIGDHSDGKQLNIRSFTCFLNHSKLIELLRMFQVENERMARSIANKVLQKRVNLAHTRKSVGALSRADRRDGANPLNHPLFFSGWLGIIFPVKSLASWVGPRRARVAILPQYGNACPVADLENPPIEFDEIWHVYRSSESKNFFLVTFWPLDILKVKGHAPKSRGLGILRVFGLFCNHILLKNFWSPMTFQVRKFISHNFGLLTPPSISQLTRVISDIHFGVNKFWLPVFGLFRREGVRFCGSSIRHKW